MSVSFFMVVNYWIWIVRTTQILAKPALSLTPFANQTASLYGLAAPSSKFVAWQWALLWYRARQGMHPKQGWAMPNHFDSARYDENVVVGLDCPVQQHSFYQQKTFLPTGLITSLTHAKTALDRRQTAHISLWYQPHEAPKLAKETDNHWSSVMSIVGNLPPKSCLLQGLDVIET